MADNFYAKYSANEPSVVVTSLNSLSGALTLLAGANITITPGAGSLTIAGAASGANTSLSNLASPTALNRDLIYGTADVDWTIRTANNGAGDSGDLILASGTATGTRGNVQLASDSLIFGAVGAVSVIPANGGTLGSAAAPFAAMLTTISGIFSGGGQYTFAAGPIATPSGASVNGTINSHANSGFTIFSTSQAGNTGPLAIETGNSSSFDSGNISIRTGTAAGTRGSIVLTAATLNLSAAPLGATWLPAVNTSYSLGSGAKAFNTIFTTQVAPNTGNLLGLSSTVAVDVTNGTILNLPVSASDPISAGVQGGSIYYNSVSGKLRFWNDDAGQWETIVSA